MSANVEFVDHVYVPDGAVLTAFYHSNHRASFCIGPVGSGKTRCMLMKMLRHICEAYPCKDGVRRTRWLFVRNTYPDLDETSIPDFNSVFVDPYPEDYFGTWKLSVPKKFTFDFEQAPGDRVYAEVTFMAFDDAKSIKQAKSMQLTGAIFHECRYLDRAVIGNILERCGRFPPKEDYMHHFPDGTDFDDMTPQWHGAIGDSNMPEEVHFLPIMAQMAPIPAYIPVEERTRFQKPENWAIYRQPPGLREKHDARGDVCGYEPNPRAENLKWLPGGSNYYMEKINEGKAYVDSQILNKPAVDKAGQPVHPSYNDQKHYAAEAIEPVEDRPLIIGVDFGVCFAAEIMQNVGARWAAIDEVFLKGLSTKQSALHLKRHLAEKYPLHFQKDADPTNPHPKVIIWCGDDGKFKTRHNDDLLSDIEICRSVGLQVLIAPGGNRLSVRRAAMDGVLDRAINGSPALIVSSRCPMLRTGLQSGYHWKEGKGSSGESIIVEDVAKNDYSHPVEAGHYALLGGGEGNLALGRGQARKVNTMKQVNVYDRGERQTRASVFRR